MNNIVYQQLFDKLQEGLPEEWDKVVLYIAYFEGSYAMKYYVKNDKNMYNDCYSIKGLSNSKLAKLFIGMDKILTPEREALGNKKWSVMTMIVSADGDFKVEYDYSKIDDISLDYEEAWEKKYLK